MFGRTYAKENGLDLSSYAEPAPPQVSVYLGANLETTVNQAGNMCASTPHDSDDAARFYDWMVNGGMNMSTAGGL